MRSGDFYANSAQPLLTLLENYKLPWSLVPGYYDHINGMSDFDIGSALRNY